jgi:hypothetical protein
MYHLLYANYANASGWFIEHDRFLGNYWMVLPAWYKAFGQSLSEISINATY